MSVLPDAGKSTKTPEPQNVQVSLLYRIQCALSLMLGVRRHDFRIAARYIELEYAHLAFFPRYWQFLIWSLRQMLVVIPEASPMMTKAPRVSKKPLWLEAPNPLENYPWRGEPNAKLPDEVHTVVIGAGFAGASIAYHWSKRAGSEQGLVVLEMNEAASGASGRNAGAVVPGRYYLMVRNSVETHLKRIRTDLTPTQLRRLAEQFAHAYCKAAYHNRDLIEQTIKQEGFEVEFACKGLFVEHDGEAQQKVLEEAVSEAARTGFDSWEKVEPEIVHRQSGMRVKNPAAFSADTATWQPAKWVWSLLSCALKSVNVSLFTHTKVVSVDRQANRYLILTSRGTIRAQNVIYAVESFLPKLDKRFHNIIEPQQEQASAGIGAPSGLPSDITVGGKLFYGTRRKDKVLIGSDSTRVPDRLAGQYRPSRFLTRFALSELQRLFGAFGWHLTHEWAGTVSYTPDGYPLIGPLDEYGKYMIGGMAGSGSGIAFNAARCIVNRILNLTKEPDDYPEEYFAPSRLLDPRTHNWPELKV